MRIGQIRDDRSALAFPRTVKDLFYRSLSETNVKLVMIPTALILFVPRQNKSGRSDDYIVPNREFLIDSTILRFFCPRCLKTESDLYSCDQRSESRISPIDDSYGHYLCKNCSELSHNQPRQSIKSSHQHRMSLFAVLCADNDHYTSFVKCRKNGGFDEWLFYDSFDSHMGNKKCLPSVSRVDYFDRWLQNAETNPMFYDELKTATYDEYEQCFTVDTMTRRKLLLFRNSTLFFYERVAQDN